MDGQAGDGSFAEKTTIMEANRIRTGHRRKAAKWEMPVSRKFYLGIMEQVESLGQCCPSLDVERMKMIITEFARGHAYAKPLSEMETVVVKLLCPLIEKARQRSARARMAASNRRVERMRAEKAEAAANETQAESTPSPVSAPSRHEAAQERRRLKHLKRIARRQAAKEHGDSRDNPDAVRILWPPEKMT